VRDDSDYFCHKVRDNFPGFCHKVRDNFGDDRLGTPGEATLMVFE
jgi:hypothetical protein